MIKSMTGYGSAKGSVEGLEISGELKSVNNRYLDCSVRLPRSFLFAEDMVKSCVQKHISRGKVDVFVSVNSSGAADMDVQVNEALLKGYVEAVRHIAEEYGLHDDLSAMGATRFPDVLSVEKKDLDDFERRLTGLIEEIFNPGLDFQPYPWNDGNPENSVCKYCNFKRLCNKE